MDVAVLDPHGHKDTVRPMVTQRSEFVWNVDYTPKEQGLHSVNVFFAGKAIPYSPFPVGVAPGQLEYMVRLQGHLVQVVVYGFLE